MPNPNPNPNPSPNPNPNPNPNPSPSPNPNQARGRSAAQVSLRHSLQRGCAVLARSTSPARIEANAKLFDFELSEEEMAALDALERGERTYWDNSQVP